VCAAIVWWTTRNRRKYSTLSKNWTCRWHRLLVNYSLRISGILLKSHC
jgi:hypothetical protein